MDYGDIPVPEPRQNKPKRRNVGKPKRVSKPKQKYAPVRGYAEDFALVSRRGIATSPDSVADPNLTENPIENLPDPVPSYAPCVPAPKLTGYVNPKLQWVDVVKRGVFLAEWDLLDDDIFVLDL